jgi:hypothetical protein
MLPFDASFPQRVAVELREIAEQEPTIADELRRIADELDGRSRVVSIYPRSAVLGGSARADAKHY